MIVRLRGKALRQQLRFERVMIGMDCEAQSSATVFRLTMKWEIFEYH
jgi:hypothetical protein